MAQVAGQRMAAEIDGDFVVFLIGARLNKFRLLQSLMDLGGRRGMKHMLDYLAARFVENAWSIKSMHREIMLSRVYGLSSEDIPANSAVDPDDRLLWRANWQRMDAETLRDSLLFVSGNLDLKAGGPPTALSDNHKRRAVYGFVSRRKLDPMLALFDFPNPNSTSEQRVITNVPLQRLYMMNSIFLAGFFIAAGGLFCSAYLSRHGKAILSRTANESSVNTLAAVLLAWGAADLATHFAGQLHLIQFRRLHFNAVQWCTRSKNDSLGRCRGTTSSTRL
jgi:hypothetical protein